MMAPHTTAHDSLRAALSYTLGSYSSELVMKFLENGGLLEDDKLEPEKLERALESIMGEGAAPIMRIIMMKKST
jgi:hypothetical protein